MQYEQVWWHAAITASCTADCSKRRCTRPLSGVTEAQVATTWRHQSSCMLHHHNPPSEAVPECRHTQTLRQQADAYTLGLPDVCSA